MSSPDIQTLISRSCLIHLDQAKTTPMNPDDLEHPSKLIKFLVGVRQQNEYFPIGGPWSPSLDGPNPDSDPQVLVRTAVRCVQAQTGIDLSKCIQWYVGSAQIDRPPLSSVFVTRFCLVLRSLFHSLGTYYYYNSAVGRPLSRPSC